MSGQGLTARDLIAILTDLDPDTEVFIGGYESGVNSASGVRPVRVAKFANTDWWMGQHAEVTFAGELTDSDVIGVEIVGNRMEDGDE